MICRLVRALRCRPPSSPSSGPRAVRELPCSAPTWRSIWRPLGSACWRSMRTLPARTFKRRWAWVRGWRRMWLRRRPLAPTMTACSPEQVSTPRWSTPCPCAIRWKGQWRGFIFWMRASATRIVAVLEGAPFESCVGDSLSKMRISPSSTWDRWRPMRRCGFGVTPTIALR